MLTGLLTAGFQYWHLAHADEWNRTVAAGTNALASSVVLVCRPRPVRRAARDPRSSSPRSAAELPEALRSCSTATSPQSTWRRPPSAGHGRLLALRQGAGGRRVADAVRAALALINQALDEVLAEQEGEFDADTRWAIAWFEQFGMRTGAFGDAETLSRAKNTSVAGHGEAGLVEARAGKVRLLRRDELDEGWDPPPTTG